MRSRLRGERGQSAVEFALFVPVLVVVLYVVVQFGQIYLQYQEVSAATSEGARRASTMAGIADPGRTATITSTVRAGTSVGTSEAFDSTNLAVTVNSSWTPGSPVTVTSTYPASVTFLGVTLFSGTLTTKRTVRVTGLMSRLRALRRGERGQALVLSVLMLAALLGIASLVVDGGNALLQRRNQQGVADAAAIAAVRGSSVRHAHRRFDRPRLRDDAEQRRRVDRRRGPCHRHHDGLLRRRLRCYVTLAPASVCVVVHTDTQGVFSRLLGLDFWKEDARAIAQASQVTAAGGWLPFGVRLGAFTDDPPTQFTITPCDSRTTSAAWSTRRRDPNASSMAATRSPTSSRARATAASMRARS